MISRRGKLLGVLLFVGACKRDALEQGLPPDASGTGESASRMLDAAVARDLDAAVGQVATEAGFVRCTSKPECGSILTRRLELGACCTASDGCGLEFLHAGDMGPAYFTTLPKPDPADPYSRCVPVEQLFTVDVTPDSRRVPSADGGTILVTSSCPTALFDNLEFQGCCLPNSACGLSTYPVHSTLEFLLGANDQPFAQVECVTADELNAQFRAAGLPGFANFSDPGTACDYLAAYALLPPTKPVAP
jgi:hypothetical protein